MMLREIDIDGAPLLFHAASSRCEHSCFRTAYDLIGMVLGKGGAREQVEAVDGLGRGILMHAARSNHVQTFKEVLRRYKEGIGSMSQGYYMWADTDQPATTAPPEPTEAELLLETDIFGMNCLHHAAEAGCLAVFQEVFSICQRAEGSLYERTYKPDKTGRTPIIFVLRNKPRCEKDELKTKFDMLYKALPYGPPATSGGHHRIGWMVPTPVPSQVVPKKGEGIKTRAKTELMHAARGGLASLEIFLSLLPRTASKDNGDSGFTVELDEALAVEVKVKMQDGTWGQSTTNDPIVWGRALLLAAAAKLGDVDVLYHILDAIEVSGKCWLGERVVRYNHPVWMSFIIFKASG